MHSVAPMLKSHPRAAPGDGAERGDSIHACYDCAQACTTCADACLGESGVADLIRCIRLNQDCFDVCVSTGNILSRLTEPNGETERAQLEACLIACRTCAEECERHAHHMEHCRICAEACRRCAEACEAMLSAATR